MALHSLRPAVTLARKRAANPKSRNTPPKNFKRTQELVLLLDDTSCCSNGNVMLRESKPSWPVSLLTEIDRLRIFVNPILERNLKAKRITIDALDFADDSLSLETDYGKRLMMSVGRGRTWPFFIH